MIIEYLKGVAIAGAIGIVIAVLMYYLWRG